MDAASASPPKQFAEWARGTGYNCSRYRSCSPSCRSFSSCCSSSRGSCSSSSCKSSRGSCSCRAQQLQIQPQFQQLQFQQLRAPAAEIQPASSAAAAANPAAVPAAAAAPAAANPAAVPATAAPAAAVPPAVSTITTPPAVTTPTPPAPPAAPLAPSPSRPTPQQQASPVFPSTVSDAEFLLPAGSVLTVFKKHCRVVNLAVLNNRNAQVPRPLQPPRK